MTAPTYTWNYVPDVRLDAFSPPRGDDFEDMAENLSHDRQICYDPATHSPDAAHTHDGAGSARIYPPSPNVIGAAPWNRAQYEEATVLNIGGSASFATGDDSGKRDPGARMQTAGDYAAASMENVAAGNFGTSTRVTASILARSIGVQSAGELRFGVSTNGTSFLAGGRGSVAYGSLPEGWTRYYLTADVAITSGLWILAYVQTTFTTAIRVDAVSVTFGNQLGWWGVCPMNSRGAGSSNAIDFYLRDVSWIPCFDEKITRTRAIKVAAV